MIYFTVELIAGTTYSVSDDALTASTFAANHVSLQCSRIAQIPSHCGGSWQAKTQDTNQWLQVIVSGFAPGLQETL